MGDLGQRLRVRVPFLAVQGFCEREVNRVSRLPDLRQSRVSVTASSRVPDLQFLVFRKILDRRLGGCWMLMV